MIPRGMKTLRLWTTKIDPPSRAGPAPGVQTLLQEVLRSLETSQ